MTYRKIAGLALVAAIILGLVDVTVAARLPERPLFWYNALTRLTLLALVSVATGAAAWTFGWWRDYLGRAWTLLFAEYALLTVTEVLRRFGPDGGRVHEVTLIVANLAGVGAFWLFSRALRAAGLEYYGSTAKRIAFLVGAAVVAAALLVEPIVANISAGLSQVPSLVSAAGDLTTFLLVAPMLLTLLALRGGQLFWIFALLTVGTFGWMVNNGASTIVKHLGWGAGVARSGRMIGLVIACCFIAAAGAAQWLSTVRSVHGEPTGE